VMRSADYSTSYVTNLEADDEDSNAREMKKPEGCCISKRYGSASKAGTMVLLVFLLGACLRLSLRVQLSCRQIMFYRLDHRTETETETETPRLNRNWFEWGAPLTQRVEDFSPTTGNNPTVQNEGTIDRDQDDWIPNVVFRNYSMPITFDCGVSGCASTGGGSDDSIQTMFDMGLMECYGFAFFEARKTATNLLAPSDSFLSGQPREGFYCPMCHWLLAMGYSPYINHPIVADKSSYETAATAASFAFEQAHSERSNPPLSLKELGLIDAMNLRFHPSFANQTVGYVSYSQELKDLHETIVLADGKGDPDVIGFLADSIMILHCDNEGYRFYDETDQQTPKPEIAYAIRLLEDCLEISPDHPLCQHLYIHVTEPSENLPAHKAGTVADRLSEGSYATEAQHLQHMPSHTYLRIGRYHDAVASNIVAHESDEAYNSHGFVPYGPGHDIAFLIHAAQLSGERETAYRYADVLRDHYREYPTKPDGPGTEQGWHVWRTVRLRFGDYASILEDSDDIASIGSDRANSKAPGSVGEPLKPTWPYAIVLGHYNKGIASLWNHSPKSINADDDEKLLEAMHHLQSLRETIPDVDPSYHGMSMVANLTLSAAIEYYRQSQTVTEMDRDYDAVLQLFRQAREEQESWAYTEPPSWYTTVALCEGTIMRKLARYNESIESFRNDLKRVPKNRYGLFGLKTAMIASGANAIDIEEVTKRFDAASYWSDHDVRNTIPLVCPELGE